MSINRAEERLFAKDVGEFRPPTPAIDLTGFLDELREGLCSLLEATGLLYTATDGSARSDIAASAVVLHCSVLRPALVTKTCLPLKLRCRPSFGWLALV